MKAASWGVALALLALALASGVAQGAPAESLIEVRTTISRVYPYSAAGVPACNIGLANGRTILGASGADCQAQRGRGVVLFYREYVVESRSCDWRGRCKAVAVPQRVLDNYYIVGN